MSPLQPTIFYYYAAGGADGAGAGAGAAIGTAAGAPSAFAAL